GGKKEEEFTVDDEQLKTAGDRFEGYTMTSLGGVPVVELFYDRRQPVEALAAGQKGYVALQKTPFYLEAGGQVSDSGRIFNDASGASATVEGLARIRAGLPRAHPLHVHDSPQ